MEIGFSLVGFLARLLENWFEFAGLAAVRTYSIKALLYRVPMYTPGDTHYTMPTRHHLAPPSRRIAR